MPLATPGKYFSKPHNLNHSNDLQTLIAKAALRC